MVLMYKKRPPLPAVGVCFELMSSNLNQNLILQWSVVKCYRHVLRSCCSYDDRDSDFIHGWPLLSHTPFPTLPNDECALWCLLDTTTGFIVLFHYSAWIKHLPAQWVDTVRGTCGRTSTCVAHCVHMYRNCQQQASLCDQTALALLSCLWQSLG